MEKKEVEKKSRQFVIFKVGEQEFGADIHKVSIVEKMMNIARVPTTPSYVQGVINLRGEIIPIINLRIKFGLPEMEDDEDTRIIIFKFNEVVLGVIVDIVSEVIFFDEDNIESVTSITNDRSLDYIVGIAKHEGRLITLLNIEKLISELAAYEAS